MKLQIGPIAARWLPDRLAERLAPAFARLDEALSGEGDSAVSGRIAMFVFAIRVLSAAIAYVSQVLLARWMGGFEYGVFVAVWVAAVILGGLACLGFQTGIIRFIAEYRTAGQNDFLRGSISGALIWSLFASTLIAAAGSAGVWYFADWFENYYLVPIYLAAICLPMLSLQEVQDGVARAFNWPGVALAPTFILRPLLILAAMAIAIAAGFEPDAPTAMIATIIAVYCASLLQFFLLRRRLARTVPAGPRRYTPVQWIAIAMPIFLVEGFYTLLTNIDILFVSHYMQPEDVAVYFAATKTLALVHFVYFAVKAAAAHRYSAYRTAGDHATYERFIQQTVSWTFWPSLALAAFMAFAGKYFLMLFGEGFASGEAVIWVLAIGIVARAAVGPAESVLTMSGEQKICAALYAMSLMVNVILNITLIPIYGLLGAAIATTGAMIFESLALYAVALRRLDLHIVIFADRFTRRRQAAEHGAAE